MQVEVAENLWCGSHPYDPRYGIYQTANFDAVVNVSFRPSARASQTQLVIWSPLRDNAELPPTIEMLAEAVANLSSKGYKVLVHCDQGLNRAPFICALALRDRYTIDALDEIRYHIPGCLTNQTFVNYLRGEVRV